MSTDRVFVMRTPCPACAYPSGKIIERNGQDTVRCLNCNRHCYNAPRTETGRAQRSITTVHNGIKPQQRARVLERDRYTCLCGQKKGNLHVGHILSVEAGLRYGVTDEMLNDDENLVTQCEECNLGQGELPMSLPLAIAILRARIAWKRAQR